MDPSTTNPVPPAHPAPLDPVLLEDPAARCPAFPPVNTQSLRADADLVDPVDPDADLADQDAVRTVWTLWTWTLWLRPLWSLLGEEAIG